MKKVIFILVVILVIAQFFRPSKNIGDSVDLATFYNETNASEEIQNILKVSCNDCHSSNTNYPWYSNITPVNYFLANHVNEGKGHLNFSNWNSYDTKKKDHKLEELIEEIEKGGMPLGSYTTIHSDAKLNDEQIQKLIFWVKEARKNIK
ncbi:MAG: heme-binding domain-containing protein [Moheibacter sp.]